MQGPGQQPQSLVKLHQLISIATEIGKVAVVVAATDDNNNDATTTTTAYYYLLVYILLPLQHHRIDALNGSQEFRSQVIGWAPLGATNEAGK